MLGSYCFANCDVLNEVFYSGSREPDITGNSVFEGCNSLYEVNVPANYGKKYFCGVAVKRAPATGRLDFQSQRFFFMVVISTFL